MRYSATAVIFGVFLFFSMSIQGQKVDENQLNIGYIPVESIENGNAIAQHLLRNNWVENAVVVPVSMQNPTTTANPTASHLLLLEARRGFLSNVKSAVNEIYKGSSLPQILFSPASEGLSHLDFINSPASTDDAPPARPTPARPTPARPTPAGEKQPTPAAGESHQVFLGDETDVTAKGVVNDKFNFIVKGNPSTGYMWKVDKASASLRVGSFKPFAESTVVAPGFVGAPTRFSLEVVPTEAGEHMLTIKYARPWEKTNADAEFKHIKIVAAAGA